MLRNGWKVNKAEYDNILYGETACCMYKACLQTLCLPLTWTHPITRSAWRLGCLMGGALPLTKVSAGTFAGDSEVAIDAISTSDPVEDDQ